MRFKPLIAITLLLSLSVVAYAHPGRTDSNGGHTDHSTGEYHYHHGQPAHQHYDIDGDGDLDCPYKTAVITKPQDETTSSSNDITDYLDDNEEEVDPTELQKEEPPSPKETKTVRDVVSSVFKFLYNCLIVLAAIFFGVCIVGAIICGIADVIKRNRR